MLIFLYPYASIILITEMKKNVRTGTVFDIKEFAIHDGPGIRVTVFMKGCPLRCSWCHNPEGISPEPQVIRRGDGERIVGKSYSPVELANLINSKKDILRNNDGGVTFSGGEPLTQAGFISEVIDRLDGVHVLLDTSGHGSKEDLTSLAARCDLVYFDLKIIDNQRHREYTGKDNRKILQNLKVLSMLDIPYVIRVPLIPGVTDTDKNLSDIAEIVYKLPGPGMLGVELLPYNRVAGGKYGSAGMEFRPGFDESIDVNLNTDIFRNNGLEVKAV
jgi:pyruvate formate lyase activating enzyme